MTTNFSEVEERLRQVLEGMFKSSELKEAGHEVAKIMGENVQKEFSDSGRRRFGNLEKAIESQVGVDTVHASPSSLSIGFGEVDFMDSVKRKDEFQVHMVAGRSTPVAIFLKGETELPEWIVNEFGAWNGATVPEQFQVGYTRRPEKDILVGPALNIPKGSSGRGWFMATEKNALRNGWKLRRGHSEIKAGHFFSGGLEKSKDQIYEHVGNAIDDYLKRVTREDG